VKKYFITGLLIWVPLGITLWVLHLLVSTMDQTLTLLPEHWQPDQWLGVHIPGLGALITVAVVFLSGLFAANIIGQRLVMFWEGVLARIAFLTGRPGGDVVNHLKGDYVSVYVPTTPNPTSGFFLMLPMADVIELDMSVDTALKYIISMGVVVPGGGWQKRQRRQAQVQAPVPSERPQHAVTE